MQMAQPSYDIDIDQDHVYYRYKCQNYTQKINTLRQVCQGQPFLANIIQIESEDQTIHQNTVLSYKCTHYENQSSLVLKFPQSFKDITGFSQIVRILALKLQLQLEQFSDYLLLYLIHSARYDERQLKQVLGNYLKKIVITPLQIQVHFVQPERFESTAPLSLSFSRILYQNLADKDDKDLAVVNISGNNMNQGFTDYPYNYGFYCFNSNLDSFIKLAYHTYIPYQTIQSLVQDMDVRSQIPAQISVTPTNNHLKITFQFRHDQFYINDFLNRNNLNYFCTFTYRIRFEATDTYRAIISFDDLFHNFLTANMNQGAQTNTHRQKCRTLEAQHQHSSTQPVPHPIHQHSSTQPVTHLVLPISTSFFNLVQEPKFQFTTSQDSEGEEFRVELTSQTKIETLFRLFFTYHSMQLYKYLYLIICDKNNFVQRHPVETIEKLFNGLQVSHFSTNLVMWLGKIPGIINHLCFHNFITITQFVRDLYIKVERGLADQQKKQINITLTYIQKALMDFEKDLTRQQHNQPNSYQYVFTDYELKLTNVIDSLQNQSIIGSLYMIVLQSRSTNRFQKSLDQWNEWDEKEFRTQLQNTNRQ